MSTKPRGAEARSQKSPHADRILTCLQFQGMRNDCAPFTIATILNATRSLSLKGEDMAETMNKPVRRGLMPVVRRIPGSATFPWGMVDIFKEYGFRSSWRLLADADDLRNGLANGKVLMPIIGSWDPVWAHVMTLVAWDEEMGWGFANTQNDHHAIQWIPNEKFLNEWRATGYLLVEADPN